MKTVENRIRVLYNTVITHFAAVYWFTSYSMSNKCTLTYSMWHERYDTLWQVKTLNIRTKSKPVEKVNTEFNSWPSLRVVLEAGHIGQTQRTHF